jgi:hypothetical protein
MSSQTFKNIKVFKKIASFGIDFNVLKFIQVIKSLRDFIQLPPAAESKESNFLYN